MDVVRSMDFDKAMDHPNIAMLLEATARVIRHPDELIYNAVRRAILTHYELWGTEEVALLNRYMNQLLQFWEEYSAYIRMSVGSNVPHTRAYLLVAFTHECMNLKPRFESPKECAPKMVPSWADL